MEEFSVLIRPVAPTQPAGGQITLVGTPMITQSEPVRQALTALGIAPLIPSEFPSHWPTWPAEELRPQNAKKKAKEEEEEDEDFDELDEDEDELDEDEEEEEEDEEEDEEDDDYEDDDYDDDEDDDFDDDDE